MIRILSWPAVFSALAAVTLFTGTANVHAQQATPKPDSEMSREERIAAHRAKIERILEEDRKRKAAQQQGATPGAAPQTLTNQNPAASGAAAGVPTPAVPAPPGQARVAVPGQGIDAVTQAGGAVRPGMPGAQPGAQTRPGQPAKGPQTAGVIGGGARSEARSMLLMYPFDSTVTVGDTFETEVVADTKVARVDKLSFFLRYPKDTLNPLAIDHSALGALADGEITFGHDADRGEIYLSAELKEAQTLAGRPLATITWEALAADPTATVRFESEPGFETGLYLGETNVLGSGMGMGMDGVLHSSINVRSPKKSRDVQRISERELLISPREVAIPKPSISLSLVPSTTALREGEEFTVDVVLDNPEPIFFDRLSVYVQFDPRQVELVDEDRGNPVRDGINIETGFTRERFPFDYFHRNVGENETGSLVYVAGSGGGGVRSAGVVGRLHFRALRATNRADVVLVRNDPGYVPTTDVTYLDRSVLLNAPTQLGPVSGVSVAVAPGAPGAVLAEGRSVAGVAGPAGSQTHRNGGRGIILSESGLGAQNRRFGATLP